MNSLYTDCIICYERKIHALGREKFTKAVVSSIIIIALIAIFICLIVKQDIKWTGLVSTLASIVTLIVIIFGVNVSRQFSEIDQEEYQCKTVLSKIATINLLMTEEQVIIKERCIKIVYG